jgi:hypothetical protein
MKNWGGWVHRRFGLFQVYICNIERTIGASIKLFYLLKKVLLVLVSGVVISFGL